MSALCRLHCFYRFCSIHTKTTHFFAHMYVKMARLPFALSHLNKVFHAKHLGYSFAQIYLFHTWVFLWIVTTTPPVNKFRPTTTRNCLTSVFFSTLWTLGLSMECRCMRFCFCQHTHEIDDSNGYAGPPARDWQPRHAFDPLFAYSVRLLVHPLFAGFSSM